MKRMDNLIYRFASQKDIPAIVELLHSSSLPYGDIDRHIKNFLVAIRDDILIGVIGLEITGESALLRSFAVNKSEQSKGIGLVLLNKLISLALLNNIKTLYLLTTTAEDYFSNYGFIKIRRETVPEVISNTKEFSSICPSSAVCMMKKIETGVHAFSKDILRLKEDVPGSKMWAVSLDNTMLTYFEIESDCRFDMHSHMSEQITMVLEGELLFDVDGHTVVIHAGEVITIPSNVPHAVFTRGKAVKAVDAWSPVREEYK
jgi:N-acetylglutamate synthase-like GNAT family acetyltransferase